MPASQYAERSSHTPIRVTTRATTIVAVANRLGLHARPAMTCVERAMEFESSVHVKRVDQDECVDGKSIMQMMMLAATKGTQVEIIAEGPDADAAVASLRALVESRFEEE